MVLKMVVVRRWEHIGMRLILVVRGRVGGLLGSSLLLLMMVG